MEISQVIWIVSYLLFLLLFIYPFSSHFETKSFETRTVWLKSIFWISALVWFLVTFELVKFLLEIFASTLLESQSFSEILYNIYAAFGAVLILSGPLLLIWIGVQIWVYKILSRLFKTVSNEKTYSQIEVLSALKKPMKFLVPITLFYLFSIVPAVVEMMFSWI